MGIVVSALVDRAIESAGLVEVLTARRKGPLSPAHIEQLRQADLLALGALADRVRSEEVGAEVRIYTSPLPETEDAVVVLPSDGTSRAPPGRGRDEGAVQLTGLELLREVAVSRVAGPSAARVRVDWARCGLELAQVALGFGANELVGVISTKRGLPIAPGDLAGVGKKSRLLPAQMVKRKELAGYVRRAGREPVFIGAEEAWDAIATATALEEAP
jgi:2-iminoacetate synthase ThiH